MKNMATHGFLNTNISYIQMFLCWILLGLGQIVPIEAANAEQYFQKQTQQKIKTTHNNSYSTWIPTALSATERNLFYQTPEDLLTRKACIGKQRANKHCRNKKHYVSTNEYHHQLFYPYIRGIAGGYVGVGTDQNFTLIAWAQSRFAWLIDYDPVAVSINKVHRAFILESPNRQRYMQWWSQHNIDAHVHRILRQYYPAPSIHRALFEAYRFARKIIADNNSLFIKWKQWRWRASKERSDFHWLHREETYLYIRQMFQTDRIRIMRGNLLGQSTLSGIGRASHQANLPIRILYTSNAEEFWRYSSSFQANIRGLKMDQHSVVLRTRYSDRFGPRRNDKWLYVIQGGLDFQSRLSNQRYHNIDAMMSHRKPITEGFFSILTSNKSNLPISTHKNTTKRDKSTTPD
jgi:hypothetical protein